MFHVLPIAIRKAPFRTHAARQRDRRLSGAPDAIEPPLLRGVPERSDQKWQLFSMPSSGLRDAVSDPGECSDSD